MKHAVKTRRFGMTTSHRIMTMRNLTTALIKHERIETTLPKAKELRSWADNMITLAKRGDLHARRQALEVIIEKDVVKKLFDKLAERYKERPGGYTRIVKLGPRRGDAAPMAIIELVGERQEKKKKAETKAKAAKKADKKETKKAEKKETKKADKKETKKTPKKETKPKAKKEEKAEE